MCWSIRVQTQETGDGSLSDRVHLLFICAPGRKTESRNAAAGGR